jgi:hypothetical protein
MSRNAVKLNSARMESSKKEAKRTVPKKGLHIVLKGERFGRLNQGFFAQIPPEVYGL